MRLIIKSGGQEAIPEWREHFKAFAPNLEVVDWDDPGIDPETIQYALVWKPEEGRLAAMSDLRLIISAGPGVDTSLQTVCGRPRCLLYAWSTPLRRLP